MFKLVFASILLLASRAAAQQPPSISGDYIEDRSNHVFGCYCEWSGESVQGGREAILAWNVRSGSFKGVNLEGVKAAVVIFGEKTLSIGNSPRKSVVFLNSSATAEQRNAIETLLRERFRELLGQVLSVQAVPIQFHKDAAGARLRIGDEVNLEIRKAVLPDDAMLGAKLWFDPFIPLTESNLGTTLNDRFWGEEFDHRWDRSEPGVTGYYGSFTLNGR